MSYRALYREYRPKFFRDMVGQDHITSVLKNQIRTGKTAHAYLLCGTRGTGKTTAARIIARAVNCLSPVDGEPCGECEACQFALAENCPDIVEMDAASNTGVDNIREMLEDIYLSPLKLRKRVFIVDEVHMLSSGAFNALLKTLEEPPEHLVFILATTEAQKLLPTIVSRCQRYDFHRISIRDIADYLKFVTSKVGAEATDDALQIVARAANGGMRDALSLLDQCLSFCGDKLTEDGVRDVLGSMSEQYLFDVAEALLDHDTPACLRKLAEIVENGRDYNVFLSDLVAHFRALMLVKSCGECPDLLECAASTMKHYALQASKCGEAQLLYALQKLLDAQQQLRYSHAPRAYLESVLVRVARPEAVNSSESLEARLEKAEAEIRRLSAGYSAGPVETAPRAQTKEPVPSEKTTAVENVQREEPAVAVRVTSEPRVSEQVPPPPKKAVEEATAPLHSGNSERKANAVPCDDARELWRKTLDSVLRSNPLQYAMLVNGVALKLENNVLSVGFSGADQSKYALVSTPKAVARLSETISKIRPGTTASIVKYDPKAAPDTEEKLKKMFGDTLVIEND